MIFGFLSKFRIDIGKYIFSKRFFRNTKKSRKNRELCFCMIFHDFLRFSMVFLSNLLRETIENLKKSWKIMKNKIVSFSRIFFYLEKTFFRKIFFAISIPNFPRNPKIILRKSCNEFKVVKNNDSKFFVYRILVTCYV